MYFVGRLLCSALRMAWRVRWLYARMLPITITISIVRKEPSVENRLVREDYRF